MAICTTTYADMILGSSRPRPSEIVIQVRPVCHGGALQGVIWGSQTGGDLLPSLPSVSHSGRVGPPGPTPGPTVPIVRRLPRCGRRGSHRFDPTWLTCIH